MDTTTVSGQTYEYRISKNRTGFTRNGYLEVSNYDTAEYAHGAVEILVQQGIENALGLEIERLEEDLLAEGWGPIFTSTVDTFWSSVQAVKSGIVNRAQSHSLEAVIIIGNVHVPYSGNIAPDGHTNNHLGAWPADAFYGDLDGTWTDNSVNATSAPSRTQNILGDGKYDQSAYPSDIELMVGRVDFSDLSNFSKSDIELTRAYLDRNHAFRSKQWTPKPRALIDDNFGFFSGEAFAANGWRNFPALVGRENISTGDIRTQADTGSYLWTYGCGAGSYTSCNGVGTSAQFAGDSLKTVFGMFFGSYFGDWDVSNNLLRTVLAQGTTLGVCWAGRPNYYFHPMAKGDVIGASVRKSMNNQNLYDPNFFARSVHMGFLGDPTLKQQYIAPPSNLISTALGPHVELNWTASPDNVDGYMVFRLISDPGILFPGFELVSDGIIQSTSYIDSCLPDSGSYSYMVRPVKWITNAAGTHLDVGRGIWADSMVISPGTETVTASISLQVNGWTLTTTNNSFGASNYLWDFGDGTNSTDFEPVHQYQNPGNYTVTLTASNECDSDIRGGQVDVIVTGISNLEENGFMVFPNPGSEQLTVEIENDLAEGELVLIDARGVEVLRDRFSNQKTKTILTGHLASGIYLIKLKTANQSMVQTWVKQ